MKLLFDNIYRNIIRIYKEYIFIYTILHLYYIILNINHHVILYVSIILYIFHYNE